MSVVKDLERKVQSLEDQLSAAKKSLYEARLVELKLVPARTVVLYRGNEFLFVSTTKYWNSGDKPWLIVRRQKKDGTFGERETTIYSEWEIKA